MRCELSQMLNSITLSCDGERSLVAKLVTSHCQEKLLAFKHTLPVPQTDTGSQDENSKVSERTLVKELGKMTP